MYLEWKKIGFLSKPTGKRIFEGIDEMTLLERILKK
jgi:hypothetical protein